MPAQAQDGVARTLWPLYEFNWTTSWPSLPEEPVLLTINGSVSNSLNLTLADLKAYPQHAASMVIDGVTVSGTGPTLTDLINSSYPEHPGTSFLYIFSDGPLAGAPLNHIFLYEYPYVIIIYDDNTLELVADGLDDAEGMRITGITALTIVEMV